MDLTMYRQAEDALWRAVGVQPVERWVRLAGSRGKVRVLELGSGDPVLFLHGAPNAASTWAPLAARLEGFRLILVDRPGAGLSDPLANQLTEDSLPDFADHFAASLLDALGIERADLVASSFGGYLALRSAVRHPDRFHRMVQLGCPAFIPGVRSPLILRMLASPLRHAIRSLPDDPRGSAMSLRQLGHGASVAAGKIPATMLGWMSALRVATETFVHETDMIAALANPWRGAARSLNLRTELIGAVRASTLVLWGADEPFGGLDVGRALVDALPDAVLEVLPNAGHLPWLDDPGACSQRIRTYLAATAATGQR